MPIYGKVSIGSWGDDNSSSDIDLSNYTTKEEFELLKTEVKEEFIDVNSQLDNITN
jgi:ERCC4-related helicase